MSTSDITITKPLNAHDVAELVLMVETYVATSQLDICITPTDYGNNVLSLLQRKGVFVRLAKCCGKLVGFAIVTYDHSRRELWIESLYVESAFRRQGLARRLLWDMESDLAATQAERFMFRTISVPQRLWLRFTRGIKFHTRKIGYFTRADYNKLRTQSC